MLKGYITIAILLIADLVLYLTNGISLIGQISDKILFWIWLIFTPIVIIKYFKKKWTKWYLGLIGILLILSLFPMGLPMISIISFAIENDDERKVENYRLREGAKSAIAIPKIYLLKNWGIIEKKIGETDFEIEINGEHFRLNEFDKINLSEEKDSLNFEFIIREKRTNKKFEKE